MNLGFAALVELFGVYSESVSLSFSLCNNHPKATFSFSPSFLHITHGYSGYNRKRRHTRKTVFFHSPDLGTPYKYSYVCPFSVAFLTSMRESDSGLMGSMFAIFLVVFSLGSQKRSYSHTRKKDHSSVPKYKDEGRKMFKVNVWVVWVKKEKEQ